MNDEPPATWHAALVFALTGERRAGLGRQDVPDLDVVVAAAGPGPYGRHAVPPDLTVGIGPARFAAVQTALRARLTDVSSRPVVADRSPDADERRLLADVPPHH